MRLIRDGQTIVGMLEGGAVAAELGKEITDTLAALKEHCGGRPKAKAKGVVTLTFQLEVEGSSANITADIAAKRPKPVRGSSFYWVMDDGALSTEHPQQIDMGFSGPRVAADRG